MDIKNIILDPGHGGLDSSGKYTTAPNKMHTFSDGRVVYEGVLNRQIAGKLGYILEGHTPYNVFFTVKPDDPRDIALSQRKNMANMFPKYETIYISIHCNASSSHRATGFEIYTSPGPTKSDKLAEFIADSVGPLYRKMSVKLRYDLSDGDKDKEAEFYVLTKTKCPAVLLELGFFDYEPDLDLLEDDQFQWDLAQLIYEGIVKFIEDENNRESKKF